MKNKFKKFILFYNDRTIWRLELKLVQKTVMWTWYSYLLILM